MILAATILKTITIIWIALIVGTVVIELATEDLDCVWFSCGALVALILDLLGVQSIVIQIAAFAVVSCVLLFTVGRWAKRMMQKRTIATNIDAAIGQEVVVIKGADHLTLGEGKYNGVTWSLICKEGESVSSGDVAIITAVSGNKLFVTKLQKEEK